MIDRAGVAPKLFSLRRESLCLILSFFLLSHHVHAAGPTTSIVGNTVTGNASTQVVLPPPGGNIYGIQGGYTAGSSLYHSFIQFNVGAGDIAQFQTSNLLSNAGIGNILGRITSQSPSSIFGTIDSVTYYPAANLFLMNPSGFLFGPNAMVNVGGMMTFTTADYLQLANGGRFNANPNTVPGDNLIAADVVAFGFLTTNLHPAPITFEGGQLTVVGGTGLALVGGDINLLPDASGTPSSITAPGRTIQITSVAGPGEVTADMGIPTAGMALGAITLGQGTTFSTVGDPAFGDGSGGAVSIRGGQLVATGAKILTNFASGTTGHGGDVTIATTGSTAFTSSTIDTRTIDPQSALVKGDDAGAINITASDLTLTNSGILTGVRGDPAAASLSTGTGGAVTLTGSDSVTLTHSAIDTSTANSDGNAGAVTVIAPTVTLETNSGISTQVRGPLRTTANGGSVTLGGPQTTSLSIAHSTVTTDSSETEGNAGSVTITGQTVMIGGDGLGGQTITTSTHHSSFTGSFPTSGNAGDIEINGTTVTFTNVAVLESVADSPGTFSRGGNISVNGAQNILVDNGTIFTTTTVSEGNAGNIQLTSPHVTITGGSQIGSGTEGGGGSSGTITVTGTEDIAIDGGSLITTVAGPDSLGSAGHIVLNTPDLAITGGSAVANQNFGTGDGGTVTMQGINGPAQSVLISDGSIIFTNTDIGTGPGSSIFVNAHSFTLQNGSIMFSGTNGAGNGGNILVKADSVSITEGSQVTSASVIGDSGEPPTGNAGNVTIQGLASPAQSVLIDGPGSGIFTDTQGTGAGGNIFVNANSVTLQNGGMLSATTSGTAPSATGGAITVDANTITLDTQSTMSASTTGAGDAGTIILQGTDKISLLENSSLLNSTDSTGNGGLVVLRAPTIEMQNSSNIVASTAGSGNAGNVTMEAGQVHLSGNSFVAARTQSEGRGGNITIRGFNGEGTNASAVTLSGGSQLITETIGDGENLQGPAGNITVDTAQLSLAEGSLFNSSSRGSTAAAGNIAINATDSILISGAGSGLQSSSVEFSFGDAGSIFMKSPTIVISDQANVSTATSLFGNAGTITVKTNNLQLQSGGTITSSSIVEFSDFPPSGSAGSVTIEGTASPAQSVLIDGSGSGIFTNTEGTGAGGNIFVNANTITMQHGGSVSSTASQATGGDITMTAGQSVTLDSGSLITASSSGPGDAGNITINAGTQLTMTDSKVTTQATAPNTNASGGNITVTATDLVWLINSQLNASVQGSSTTVGGNIVIDPQSVILQNSQILAQATQGNGGNILITTNLLLPDATSTISSSSQTGVNGTVTIQSPNAPAGGKIVPLSQQPLIATSLLNQRCAALAPGNFSSFTVAGRDSLPAEPSSWLASPLALTSEFGGINAGSATRISEPAEDAPLLSLRQIAPPGFLTQRFAGDSPGGCTS